MSISVFLLGFPLRFMLRRRLSMRKLLRRPQWFMTVPPSSIRRVPSFMEMDILSGGGIGEGGGIGSVMRIIGVGSIGGTTKAMMTTDVVRR